MPEPVVIIGPAGGPEGPISGHAATPETATAAGAETAATDPGAAAPSARGAVVLRAFKLAAGFFLSITNRVVWGFVRVITLVIRNYPRHSLAAGASLVILGGILYSQSGSRTPGRDVTNAIKGNGSAQADDAQKPGPGDAGPKVAGDPAPGEGPGKEESNTKHPASSPTPDKTDSVIVQTDPKSQPTLPAPAPETTEPTLAPAGSLVQAGAPEKDGHKLEPAPAPAASGSDTGLAPLPATVGDTAKATLLAGPGTSQEAPAMPPAPSPTAADDKKKGDVTLTGASPSDKEAVAPAPSPSTAGEQTAKADSMPEVPGDLLLPESAPKAGEDKPKESKPGENSPLPIAIAESKPLDEPKKIEVPTPTPIEPAAKPAALAGGKSVVEQGARQRSSRAANP